MTNAGEANTTAGDAGATTQAPVALTADQIQAVNDRFNRDKAAFLNAERARWEADNEAKVKAAQMTAEQKAVADASAAVQRAADAEAKVTQLERLLSRASGRFSLRQKPRCNMCIR